MTFGLFQIMGYLAGYGTSVSYGADVPAGSGALAPPGDSSVGVLLHNTDLLVIGAAMVAIGAVLVAAAHSTWRSARARAD